MYIKKETVYNHRHHLTRLNKEYLGVNLQVLRLFCVPWGIWAKKKLYSLGSSSDLVSHSFSINARSMAEMLRQRIHETIL